MLTYKSLNSLAPQYLTELFTKCSESNGLNLRAIEKNLQIPLLRTAFEDLQEVHHMMVFRYFNVSFCNWCLFLDFLLLLLLLLLLLKPEQQCRKKALKIFEASLRFEKSIQICHLCKSLNELSWDLC